LDAGIADRRPHHGAIGNLFQTFQRRLAERHGYGVAQSRA
jgi:hypothetical protein